MPINGWKRWLKVIWWISWLGFFIGGIVYFVFTFLIFGIWDNRIAIPFFAFAIFWDIYFLNKAYQEAIEK